VGTARRKPPPPKRPAIPQAATASVAELSIALYLWLVRELRPKADGARAGGLEF
jgi:hypothetical protein